jgi:hypothetical protein
MDLGAQHDALHVLLQKTVPAESYSKLAPSQAGIEPKKPQKTATYRLPEPKFPENAGKLAVFPSNFPQLFAGDCY